MSEKELYSCPFCGDESDMIRDRKANAYFVQCMGCGADGPPKGNRTEAVIAWNKRQSEVAHA